MISICNTAKYMLLRTKQADEAHVLNGSSVTAAGVK